MADPPPPDNRRFVKIFPYKTAWMTIANISLVSFVVIAATGGLYLQDSLVDFEPVLVKMKELGELFAVAYMHREYYTGRPGIVARGVALIYPFTEAQKELLEAKKKSYYDTYSSGLKVLSGWQTHGRSRYYISKGKKTWYDAQKFCTDRNAHLASIHTAKEQAASCSNKEQAGDLFKKFITSQFKDPAWIGLTDEDEEGRWTWSDESWFTTQFWADGEPSNKEGNQQLEQDCTSIVPSSISTSVYNWKDDNCDQLHAWVCKQFRG